MAGHGLLAKIKCRMAAAIPGGPGVQTLCTSGQTHLFQESALLTQAHLHFPDDLLELATLLLHVSLLPAQPLLQSWEQYTGRSLPAFISNNGGPSYRGGYLATAHLAAGSPTLVPGRW